MKVRVWSKKVVAVLRYFRHHPHCTLFGVTGDVDNLGIYVARNGRSKAEILVDTYNRFMGSIFYEFLGSRPHEFFEACFLPAGEEIFILGTASCRQSVESLFARLHLSDAAATLSENIPLDIGGTNITFGCSSFSSDFMSSQIDSLLAVVENENMEAANTLYTEVLGEIRLRLSIELDRRKFASLEVEEGNEVMMRNLVYLKTIQYKEETRQLLRSAQKKFNESPETKSAISLILGREYGLRDIDAQDTLRTVSRLLSEQE